MTLFKRPEKPVFSHDWLDKDNAGALASSIEDYWRMRGYRAVRVWIEDQSVPLKANGKSFMSNRWVVRSNLVNGIPPCDAVPAAA